MADFFQMPAQACLGASALEEGLFRAQGMGSRAFIVTDEVMVKLGLVDKLQAALDKHAISSVVFDQVPTEPTDAMVEAALKLCRQENCDLLIGLGGGSPIDTMKAVAALLATKVGHLRELMAKDIAEKSLPMIAIPTTAGTGSEATRFTIIIDLERDVKMLLGGSALVPDLALVDPSFTLSCPASVTVATGVDALCHAVEAFSSRRAQELSDRFAVSAIARILDNLKTCVDEPNNSAAREQMSRAAFEAGIAFNNASVTIVHGMSRPIGALFHIAHGISNAILLETCLNFAVQGQEARFAELARRLGMTGSDDVQLAQDLLARISKLLASLKIPRLVDLGVDPEHFRNSIPKMVHDALESGSPANTLRQPSAEDLTELYQQLI